MIDLVSLAQTKAHLGRIDTDADVDIAFKITQASEIAMDYIERYEVPSEWVVSSVSPISYAIPALIQAAVLLMVGELRENKEASVSDVLSESVRSLLARYRMPGHA